MTKIGSLLAGWIVLAVLFFPAEGVGKVVLQLRWDHQFQFAGYYAAKWNGYYDEAGIAVEIRSAVPPGDKILGAVSEVSAGRADFGVGAADILMARDRGEPLVVLASIFQQSAAAFYSLERHQVASPADLVTLKVARRVDDLIDVELQALLSAEGIDLAAVPAHPHGAGLSHLIDGRVDVIPGYRISVPFQAGRAGIDLRELRPLTYGIDFYGDTLFTHRKLVEERPELVRRFTEASIRGWEYALDHPAEMADAITRQLPRTAPAKELGRFNRFQADGVRALTQYPFVAVGNTNPARWRRMHEHLARVGIVKNPLDLRALIYDPDRIAALQKERRSRLILAAVAVAAAAAAICLAWIAAMRRTVRGRTGELMASNEALLEEIRQREAAESELVASEEKLRSLFDNMHEGVWEFDAHANTTFVNRRMAEILGYTVEEIQGGNVFDFVEKKVHRKLRENLVRRRAGIREMHTLVFRNKVGRTVHVLVASAPLMDAGGKFRGGLANVMDITDRRRAEAALKESEERYRAIFEQSPDSIVLVDLDTVKFETFNDSAHRNLGYSREEFAGIAIPDIEVEESAEEVRAHVEKLIEEGEIRFDSRHRTKGGKIRDIFVRSRIVHIDGRKYALSMWQDITRRKRMEKEREVLEQQLRQLQKIEAIGALAGGIAHDFNNILVPIVGYAEMLEEDLPQEGPLHECVAEILAGTKRARDLVRQILSFSRQTEQEVRPLKPHLVLKEVCRLIRSTLPKTIEIDQRIDPACHRILADPTQIHQVAMNLVTNAYHAMRDTGGTLAIILGNRTVAPGRPTPAGLEPGEYVLIRVADTGPGVAAENLQRIFDPYFTTKSKEEGTGLGLSVVQGIVSSHGGTIMVRSAPGEGTAFDVYLPAVRSTGSIETATVARPALETGSERILVVDDEEKIVRLIGQTLERLGYRVEGRTGSLAALEAVRRTPAAFDLLITDMTMPAMTGDRLAAEILKIRPGLPVIMCTGFSEKMNAEKASAMGIGGFLMKPVVRKELAAAVRSLLDARA